MIWAPEIECMPREELAKLQLARLQNTVQWAYERVPHYRNSFDQVGFQPGDLKSIADLEKIPFTTKEVLRDNYPYGLFAVPQEEIVRVHASSGTTGKSIVVGYSRKDMETWTDLVARMVTQAGVTAKDIAQISFGYGLFTGAFGLHYGLERVGATVIPISGGNTERQFILMQDYGTTALISTPTYALHMAEVAEEMGIDTAKLNLRIGLFGAEAWTEELRNEIQQRWHITATDNYGLSEVMGPGVAGECLCLNGMHIAEDHIYWELIDPATGQHVEPGQSGELVLTTLTKEALPMIRYRTKDITTITVEPCDCGRTSARMKKITGRTDDMLIIRGVNVFPSQIESVLINIEGVEPQYQIIVKRKGFLDEIEILVEMTPQWFTDRYKDLAELENRIKQKFFTVMAIHPKVRLVEPRTIERTAGKAVRVVDLRK